MPSALSTPPWLSSRSWPEFGRCYYQMPSKKYRKHHHHTRIPPLGLGCHPSCRFSEWVVLLLGNNIHKKAQTRRKSQLHSPEVPRRRIFCSVVVCMNLLVRKLAGGMCWFALLPFHIRAFVRDFPLRSFGSWIDFCESSPTFFNSQNYHCFWARSFSYLFYPISGTDTPELKPLISSFRICGPIELMNSRSCRKNQIKTSAKINDPDW